MQTDHRTQTASLADLVLSDLPLSELAPALTRCLVEAFDGTCGAIHLYTRTDQLLRPIATVAEAAAEIDRPSYAPGQGIVGKTFESGQTTVVESVEDGPPRSRWFLASTPMKTADSIIGTVTVGWRHVARPTTEQVIHLEEMAAAITQTVDRLQLLERSRQRIKQLEVLREIGQAVSSSLNVEDVYKTFAAEAGKLIQYDVIAIATVDMQAQTVKNIYVAGDGQPGLPNGFERPLAGTMLGESIKAGASRRVSGASSQELTAQYPGLKPHAELGARSALTVPLHFNGQVIAGLGFLSADPDAYSHSDIEMAEMLGVHLAGAMANAQLYAQREESEGALRTAESNLRAVVNNAPLVMAGIDKDGIFTLIEGKGLESMGRRPGYLVGQSVFDDSSVANSVKRALEGETVSREYRRAGRVYEARYQPVRDRNGAITGVVAVGFDVTESKRTQLALRAREAEARRLMRESEILAEIGRIMSSSADLDGVFEGFAEQVRRLVPMDRIVLTRVDSRGGDGVILYTSGTEIAGWVPGTKRSLGGMFTEVVTRSGVPTTFNEEQMKAKAPGLVAAGLRSALSAPIIFHGDAIGAIHVRSKIPHAYGSREIELLERVTTQIAGTVANAQLVSDLERDSNERAVMAEIGRIIDSSLDINRVYEQFADRVKTLIPFDKLIVTLFDDNLDRFTIAYDSGIDVPGRTRGDTVPLSGTFSEAVAQAKTAIYYSFSNVAEAALRFPGLEPALDSGLRSALGAPLMAAGRLIGTIHWFSAEVNAYTSTHGELGQRVANQIAGAIQNAQTYAEIQRTQQALAESKASAVWLADENAAMAEIGQIIASSLDIHQVYERFAARTRRLIPFANLVIHIVDENSNTFTTQHSSGVRSAALHPGKRTPLDGSLTGAVVRSGKTILHAVKSREESAAEFPGLLPGIDAGFRAFLSTPLIAGGEVIGTIRWQSFDVNAYEQRHVVLAERIANYVASAVANAQIYAYNQRTQRALEQSEASAMRTAHENAVIAEISVIIGSTLDIDQVYEQFAETVGTLLQFDMLILNRVDLETQTFITEHIAGLEIPGMYPGYRGEIPGSVTEMVLKQHGPMLYVVDDPSETERIFPRLAPGIRAGVRSILAAPLIADGQVIGIVHWQSFDPDAYQETDLDLAERVAHQMAGAMSNARMYAENRRNQIALKQSEERFSGILSIADDAVVSVDESFRITMFNQGAERIFGYQAEEVIGKPLDVLIPTDLIAAHHARMSRFAESAAPSQHMGERESEVYGLRKDGTRFPAEASLSKLELDEGVVFTAILRDVTERKQAEEALRDSETRYRDLYQNAPIAYISTDADGIIVEANQRAAELFGYSLDELIGGPVLALYADTPDGIEKARKVLAETRDHSSMEMEYRRADGTQLWGSLKLQHFMDDDGNVVARRGMVVDITERKLLEAQLAQSQKMEAIGQLAGGVAHDFNNLLTAIVGYAQLASMDLTQTESIQKYIQGIKTAADRATGLTKQLLAFSRRQVIVPVVLNLNDMVIDLDNMLRRLIGEDIELVTVISPDLGAVKADAGQIEQVIVNLAVNARDAMPSGGRLNIETSNTTIGREDARFNAGISPGDYVVLTVSDTGIGMTPEVQQHVFEPFFTTKAVGEGTGLGLSTCYGIVTQSGGHITVESRLGEGTSFRVFLPSVEGAPSQEPQRDDEGFWPVGTETILLVEDEPLVRTLSVDVLEAQGYTVLRASNGAEALRIARSRAQKPIDLLLTDIVMPLMGGIELAGRFKHLHPNAKIIYMSGYPNDLPEPGEQFLQKPMTPNVLVRRVRWVLDSANTHAPV